MLQTAAIAEVKSHLALLADETVLRRQTRHLPCVAGPFVWPTPSYRMSAGRSATLMPRGIAPVTSPFSKHKVTWRRKALCVRGVSCTRQCNRQAATTQAFRWLINNGQYHFLPRMIGRYDPRRRSNRLTPPMPWLYWLMRLGCETTVLDTFLTLRVTFTTGS